MHNLIPQHLIQAQVANALNEDLGQGDLTASLIPEGRLVKAKLMVREEAILCGRAWFEEVFKQLDADISIHWQAQDGNKLNADQIVCTISGKARPILTGERTAMNFLQTLSGTATTTYQYVQALAETDTRLLDTRKTIPGLRSAQKYAVRCGQGFNHRHGLFDGVLIKENHIIAAGGISKAINEVKANVPHGIKVEVEVENLDEVKQALDAGADILLLDNMSQAMLKEAVQINQAHASNQAKLEISGNVTIENLAELGQIGVDFISVGALTKHLKATDFSLRF